MLQRILYLLVLIAVFDSNARASFTHDLASTQILNPSTSYFPINIALTPSVRFTNVGTSDESNVRVALSFRDYYGVLVYTDTQSISSIVAGQAVDQNFANFTPLVRFYRITAAALLTTDQDHTDDSTVLTLRTSYEFDVRPDSISIPGLDSQFPQKVTFRPTAYFSVVPYANDAYDVPVRFQIRRCGDGKLFFQADTVVPVLYAAHSPIRMPFPSQQGNYDVRKVPPGCYIVSAITRYDVDGNNSNDTAHSNFTIVSHRLINDVAIDSILSPLNKLSIAKIAPIPVLVRVENAGTNDQANLKTIATITDNIGTLVYRDSQVIGSLRSLAIKDIAYSDFMPPSNGRFSVKIQLVLPTDGFQYDDSAQVQITVGPTNDVAVIAITSPHDGDTILIGSTVRASVTIKWTGGGDGDQVFLRLSAIDPKTGLPFFQIDSLSPMITRASGLTSFTFPATSLGRGIGLLAPGDYTLIASPAHSDDDPSNDTARINLSVRAGYDLSLDSILEPVRYSTVKQGDSSSMLVRISNRGTHDFPKAGLSFGTADFRIDSATIPPLARGASMLFQSKKFQPKNTGSIYLMAMIHADSDNFLINNYKDSYFAYAKLGIDAECLGIVNPIPSSSLDPGSLFDPAVQVRWNGIYNEVSPTHFHISITDTAGNEWYVGDSTVSISAPTFLYTDLIFPATYLHHMTSELPIGLYSMMAYCDAYMDANRNNDTVRSQFDVGAPSVVSVDINHHRLEGVYPNPAQSIVTIVCDHSLLADEALLISDELGRVVLVFKGGHQSSTAFAYPLDISKLHNGVFFFRVQGSSKATRQERGRFIVQHH